MVTAAVGQIAIPADRLDVLNALAEAADVWRECDMALLTELYTPQIPQLTKNLEVAKMRLRAAVQAWKNTGGLS